MIFHAGEYIGGKTDNNMPIPSGKLKRTGNELFMAVVEWTECAPYHNLHLTVTLNVIPIMNSDTSAGTPAFIAGNATVTGDVTIADDVSIWYGAVIRADKDRITIHHGANIQDNAVVHTTTGCPVSIGRYVSVGHGAIIHGATIQDRVLVGMGAIVMNNAVVGEDSIIAAGSVVTEGKEIPPRSLVMGVPGKVIREASEEQISHIMKNAQSYIELGKEANNG
jgi:carbonic anhydrase/acetyltransferase-like protein (isoleucine patch superfamily)